MHTRIGIMLAFCLSTVSVFGTQSSVPFINADDVHAQGITGRGVTVAVIDTGIDYGDHGLIGSTAEGGISILDGDYIFDGGAALPGDTHGTYMSLIVTDAAGVAPNAETLFVHAVGLSACLVVADAISPLGWALTARAPPP